MENNKMLVLGGGAAACFALGYLGLQYMGGEQLNTTQVENVENINNEDSVEPKNVEVNESEKNNIIDEVSKEITKNIEKIESGWGQFWKGAYEETIKETEPSDFN